MCHLTWVKKSDLTLLRSRVKPGLGGVNPGYKVAPKKAVGGSTRNDDEVQAMLAMCADASIQLDAVRNTTVFNKVADELARKGYQRDAKQCREKLEQLKKKYKKASSRKV